MILDRLLSHLNESMHVEGDIIEFGAHAGNTFKHLVACAMRNNRIAYAIDSFQGLDEPCEFDYDTNNAVSYPKGKFAIGKATLATNVLRFIHGASHYHIIDGFVKDIVPTLDSDNIYAFAFIDLVHYTPTKEALEHMWDQMSYGSTIYFDNYFPNSNNLCSKAIDEFISLHENDIIVSRQMLINGSREKDLAIKCLRPDAKPYTVDDGITRELVVALVLKTGGEYTYEHVNNIAKSLRKNITTPFTITCLTNDATNIDMSLVNKVIPFKHDFPKWWGKIELFRTKIFRGKQVLYFDLDTFIVDNIDDIADYRGEFSGLRDFYHLYSMGSGVMSWNADNMTNIYNSFIGQENKIINSYREGDQRWIDENKPSIHFMQDMFPKKVVSYKVHCKPVTGEATIPDIASVVCFHGQPRPHNVPDTELKKYWKPFYKTY